MVPLLRLKPPCTASPACKEKRDNDRLSTGLRETTGALYSGRPVPRHSDKAISKINVRLVVHSQVFSLGNTVGFCTDAPLVCYPAPICLAVAVPAPRLYRFGRTVSHTPGSLPAPGDSDQYTRAGSFAASTLQPDSPGRTRYTKPRTRQRQTRTGPQAAHGGGT